MSIDSIEGIGATAASAATASGGRTRAAQDFSDLTQALQQGDLAGAQKAFATLQTDVPWVGRAVSGSASVPAGPVASALQSLGSALGAGDLTAAQTALGNLQQAHGGHHGHHHHADASPPTADTAAAPTTPASGIDTLA